MISLTVRQMQYFDALAQTLHFGRAAKLAGVSQPALSSQIAEMEQRLNCRLFERGGKSVRMTDEAIALLPRIERILADIRDVETTARRGRTAMEGRFRLGIIPTVAPYLLPRALPELKKHFPALQLELQRGRSFRRFGGRHRGQFDLRFDLVYAGALFAPLPLEHETVFVANLRRDVCLNCLVQTDENVHRHQVADDLKGLHSHGRRKIADDDWGLEVNDLLPVFFDDFRAFRWRRRSRRWRCNRSCGSLLLGFEHLGNRSEKRLFLAFDRSGTDLFWLLVDQRNRFGLRLRRRLGSFRLLLRFFLLSRARGDPRQQRLDRRTRL